VYLAVTSEVRRTLRTLALRMHTFIYTPTMPRLLE